MRSNPKQKILGYIWNKLRLCWNQWIKLVMKLVFNFQLGHTQTAYTIHKYIPVYTHLIAQSLQARSAGSSTHKWLNWMAWNPIWVHESSHLVQTNERWCLQIHNWYFCVRNCVCEPGWAIWQNAAGSITRDTTWQTAIKDSVWRVWSWKHPTSWFFLVFCECRGCNNFWMTFFLHWENEC